MCDALQTVDIGCCPLFDSPSYPSIPTFLPQLLTALNDCTEWGQVFILDSLAGFETRDPRDAERIVERVLPRLQHVNSAVVLSAVKVCVGTIHRFIEIPHHRSSLILAYLPPFHPLLYPLPKLSLPSPHLPCLMSPRSSCA